jgi:hypothetical protein
LNWQIINQSRELKYVKLNQSILRLIIFIDSSFVNNHDLSSQIDYVVCLTDSCWKVGRWSGAMISWGGEMSWWDSGPRTAREISLSGKD